MKLYSSTFTDASNQNDYVRSLYTVSDTSDSDMPLIKVKRRLKDK